MKEPGTVWLIRPWDMEADELSLAAAEAWKTVMQLRIAPHRKEYIP